MKILRAHGMIDTVLQQVFKSAILSKHLYASCAWWRFTKASDRQLTDNFIRRSVKSGLSCRPAIFRRSLWDGWGKTV